MQITSYITLKLLFRMKITQGDFGVVSHIVEHQFGETLLSLGVGVRDNPASIRRKGRMSISG